jgi:hypothetical protein
MHPKLKTPYVLPEVEDRKNSPVPLDRNLPLYKGAEPRDGFTENQVLHLERALIGVQGF